MTNARTYQRQLRIEAETRPITLPRIDIPNIVESEAKETAARFQEYRIVKQGLDAWQEVTRANSFEAWKKIGAALLVGKRRALHITRANAPWGQHYCREFNRWIIEHHFDRMPSPTRSVAIELAENEQAITLWRNALPEKQRRRLINPQSVVKRWRRETQPSPTESRSSEFPAHTRRNSVAASQLPSQQTDLKTAADVYLDALLRLPAPARTEELMRIANLANVRLANGRAAKVSATESQQIYCVVPQQSSDWTR
jgi:hypothetical protein